MRHNDVCFFVHCKAICIVHIALTEAQGVLESCLLTATIQSHQFQFRACQCVDAFDRGRYFLSDPKSTDLKEELCL